MANVDQALDHRLPIGLGIALLEDFVADAPEDDAGMIAIALEHADQIGLGPIIEESAIAELCFAVFPFIERFIHHDKPHAVAKIEKFWRRRIVARANGIDATRFENLELPLDCARIDGCAETTQIVMIANAVNRNVFSIQ
jgi:hypothetical protein